VLDDGIGVTRSGSDVIRSSDVNNNFRLMSP